MKKSNDKLKILYLDKEKCTYSILLSILFYFIIVTIFNNNQDLKALITSILYLIGSCTMVLLSQSIYNIYRKNYYLVICYLYIFTVMFAMFSLVPDEAIKFQWINTLKNSLFLKTIYIETIVMIASKLEVEVFDISDKITMKIVFLVSSVTFIINFIAVLWQKTDILVTSNLFVGVIVIVDIYIFKRIKFSLGNDVNGLLVLLYIYLLNVLINIASLTIFNDNILVDELSNLAIFSAYFLLMVLIVDKFINRPYRMLFGDLYKENLEMDALNGKVVKKNRELEFSQAVIRKKEKMFKTFFTSTPIPLVLISNSGRIIFANSSFQVLLEEENMKNIINKKIFNLISIKNFIDVKELENRSNKGISGIIKCTGKNKYVDIELIDISENNNEVLVIINDVTSKVNIGKLKTEMENKKFQEKIKSDFLSNISHDLKTPINVIYSASQLVSMFIENNDKKALKKYNMICKLNCFSLIRLTNNLIDSSRIYSDYLSPNLQVKNIVEIIEEIVMSLIDYAKSKNIDLVFDTDDEDVYVKIDEEFMQRIVINLVSNAIKFTNEGDKIEVSIQNKEQQVFINVKDNGVGMEKEFIQTAFNRYAMGKNNENSGKNYKKGTGIGLFVVKKLVEKQNGEISIDSEISKGTNVKMKFCKEIVK